MGAYYLGIGRFQDVSRVVNLIGPLAVAITRFFSTIYYKKMMENNVGRTVLSPVETASDCSQLRNNILHLNSFGKVWCMYLYVSRVLRLAFLGNVCSASRPKEGRACMQRHILAVETVKCFPFFQLHRPKPLAIIIIFIKEAVSLKINVNSCTFPACPHT